jgi:hypothetical protein
LLGTGCKECNEDIRSFYAAKGTMRGVMDTDLYYALPEPKPRIYLDGDRFERGVRFVVPGRAGSKTGPGRILKMAELTGTEPGHQWVLCPCKMNAVKEELHGGTVVLLPGIAGWAENLPTAGKQYHHGDQFRPFDLEEVGVGLDELSNPCYNLVVPTLHGTEYARDGDWVVMVAMNRWEICGNEAYRQRFGVSESGANQ